MCLATSNNLLQMLQDAPKRIFSTNQRSSGQPKNDAKILFFHPPSPFPGNFCNCNIWWHLYCFTILGLTSIVIHSVKQHLLRNQPGSDSCDLLLLIARKITKGIHSCKPASLNRLIDNRSQSFCSASKLLKCSESN